MARVLFINGVGEGHINPTLGVVKGLIEYGEEVVYLTGEPMRDRVESTGAKVITFDADKYFEAALGAGGVSSSAMSGGLLRISSGLLRTAEIIIPSVLEQIKGQCFDYMIHDSMSSGRLLSQILNLPAINSSTVFALREPDFDMWMENLARQFPADENERARQEFLQLASRLEEKYQVQIDSPYEVFYNPAPLTIVYTSKHFQPFGEHFDESYKFVGPSIAPRSQAEFDFSHVDTGNLIYISLGTVFNQAIDFYKLCFEAFSDTKYSVILSVGKQTAISALGEIPDNFVVRNYVPQLEVLQHAKLFVTHGGMNSTSEGLYYGVPLIVIPFMADQPMVARRVEEIGAGIHLDYEGLSSGGLRESAERVMADYAFKMTCADIGDSFRAAGGYHGAVNDIFTYKRGLGIEG